MGNNNTLLIREEMQHTKTREKRMDGWMDVQALTFLLNTIRLEHVQTEGCIYVWELVKGGGVNIFSLS